MTSGPKKQTPKKNISDEETLTATVPIETQGPTYTKIEISENKKKTQLEQIISEEFNANDLTLSGVKDPSSNADFFGSAAAPHRIARQPRYDLRLKVFIFSKNKTFKTHSDNISLSGMLLEDPVPHDCLENVFEVVIINGIDQNEKISFTGKIAGDIIDPRRVMFVEQKEQFKKSLEKLLKSYSDKMRK